MAILQRAAAVHLQRAAGHKAHRPTLSVPPVLSSKHPQPSVVEEKASGEEMKQQLRRKLSEV